MIYILWLYDRNHKFWTPKMQGAESDMNYLKEVWADSGATMIVLPLGEKPWRERFDEAL